MCDELCLYSRKSSLRSPTSIKCMHRLALGLDLVIPMSLRGPHVLITVVPCEMWSWMSMNDFSHGP